MMAVYTPGVVQFDVVGAFQNSDRESIRKRTQEWFSGFQGPIRSELKDIAVLAGDDIGFGYALNHISGTTIHSGPLWICGSG